MPGGAARSRGVAVKMFTKRQAQPKGLVLRRARQGPTTFLINSWDAGDVKAGPRKLYFYPFFFFHFLEPHLPHREAPRLGVQSELQLPAYPTATAMPEPCCVYGLHYSSWQHQILNPLSGARDRTHILMDTGQVCFYCATRGTPFCALSTEGASPRRAGYASLGRPGAWLHGLTGDTPGRWHSLEMQQRVGAVGT